MNDKMLAIYLVGIKVVRLIVRVLLFIVFLVPVWVIAGVILGIADFYLSIPTWEDMND